VKAYALWQVSSVLAYGNHWHMAVVKALGGSNGDVTEAAEEGLHDPIVRWATPLVGRCIVGRDSEKAPLNDVYMGLVRVPVIEVGNDAMVPGRLRDTVREDLEMEHDS
jgi:hypothetical protein